MTGGASTTLVTGLDAPLIVVTAATTSTPSPTYPRATTTRPVDITAPIPASRSRSPLAPRCGR